MSAGQRWSMATDEHHFKVRQLLDACARYDVNAISELLEHDGVSVDASDDDGVTPLQMAAANGHSHLVTQLLDWGANIELCNYAGLTALMHCAFHGHINVLDVLLHYGANPHTVSYLGSTALTLACRNGHVAMARELIDLGVDLESSGGNSDLVVTPLMAATIHNYDQILTMLFLKGARVNRSVSQLEYTELMLGALYSQPSIVEQLLEHGADANSLNHHQRTALDLAVKCRRTEVMSLLEQRTSVKRTSSKKEVTIGLVDAIKAGDMRRVREIIHAQPDKVNEPDALDGSTPLMHAAICGRVDMASMLVSNKAHINAIDKHSGWTALMQAVFHGYTTVAKFLVHSGADINIRSHDGHTAFDLAMSVEGTDKTLLTLLASANRPHGSKGSKSSRKHFSNQRSNWSKLTSKMFGRSCGGGRDPKMGKSWFSKVATRFKKSLHTQDFTASQTRQSMYHLDANGNSSARNPLGSSWSTENSVFKDPLSVFGATQPRTFFHKCSDIVKIQEFDGTEYASELADISDQSTLSPFRDEHGMLSGSNANPPDLVTSINESGRADYNNDQMISGSAMNRFRKSLTNRRSLRAKYAANVINTNDKQLQEKAAAVIQKLSQHTPRAEEAHNQTANSTINVKPMSQIQLWSSTAPRGDRDSNQPPDPMLAEKNAAMMGPGRLRRAQPGTRKPSSTHLSTINSTQSTVNAENDNQSDGGNSSRAAKRSVDHIRPPRIQVQSHNNKSPRLSMSSRLDGSGLEGAGSNSDSASSSAHHHMQHQQYKYASSPLGTQRRRLPLHPQATNQVGFNPYASIQRPQSYHDQPSHRLQVPLGSSQHNVNSNASSPPLTPTRRNFVMFASGSDGDGSRDRTMTSPRRLVASPSSGCSSSPSPMHARSRSLNMPPPSHSGSHTTGYMSAGSSVNRQVVKESNRTRSDTLPACSEEGIESILRDLQMPQYVDVFYEQEIDVEAFITLSDVDLRELGIDDEASRKAILAHAHKVGNKISKHVPVS